MLAACRTDTPRHATHLARGEPVLGKFMNDMDRADAACDQRDLLGGGRQLRTFVKSWDQVGDSDINHACRGQRQKVGTRYCISANANTPNTPPTAVARLDNKLKASARAREA